MSGTATEFLGADYDDATGDWTVRLRRADGTERVDEVRAI